MYWFSGFWHARYLSLIMSEPKMKATTATSQTMSLGQVISLGSAARAVILNLLSRWAAMASHSDEVFRLGL
jgi:hypothetical protein